MDTRGGIRWMVLVGIKTGLEWTYQPFQPIFSTLTLFVPAYNIPTACFPVCP